MGKRKVLTVTQLSYLLKNILEVEVPTVWVSGEVSNLSQPQSGHVYFTLRDDNAQIRCVVWRSTVERTRFEIEEGMQIVCSGNIDLYPPRGTYQLVVNFAEPLGLGPLQVAFRQLFEKLKAEGLFEEAHKQAIPAFPKRIGVVTSPSGAAIRDFLQIMSRRWNDCDVLVIPTRVQGEGVGREIAKAIQVANQLQPRLDVLVVTRGGGSMEDLWCFNEEPVVRALYHSEIPTVSAVGHEIDVTLSDLAADQRALTPSEAAEKIVPSGDEIRRRVFQQKSRLDQVLLSKLERAYDRLIDIESRPVFRKPLDRIHQLQRLVDELEMAAQKQIERSAKGFGEKLGSLARQLESVSPLNVLGRGYSLTQLAADPPSLVTSVKSIKKGDLIKSQVADGSFTSRIESVD